MATKTSTHIRITLKDLPVLKSIRNRLSEKWEHRVSYPDTIHFLIKEYQRSYPDDKAKQSTSEASVQKKEK